MASVHDAVVAREQGFCALCGVALNGHGQIHHRQPRGMGGSGKRRDTLGNMIHIHASCHEIIESNRTAAYKYGWLVQRGADPDEVEMLYKFKWQLIGEGHEVEAR